jgi:hypothetical protein
VLAHFGCGTRILRVIHGRDARTTLLKLNQYRSVSLAGYSGRGSTDIAAVLQAIPSDIGNGFIAPRERVLKVFSRSGNTQHTAACG